MKIKKRNKKIFFISIIILFFIIIILFVNNLIKKTKIGNNMSSQEIVDYILNINSYKANVTIQVNSNKNTNKYVLEQEFSAGEGSLQVVIEPENIKGTRINRKEGVLTIENTNLQLSTIFENYQGLEENCLDLYVFIQNYKENIQSNYEENEKEIILKTKNKIENKYIQNKILYINKENMKPTKLIIEDNNQNSTINIQYNEIELN